MSARSPRGTGSRRVTPRARGAVRAAAVIGLAVLAAATVEPPVAAGGGRTTAAAASTASAASLSSGSPNSASAARTSEQSSYRYWAFWERGGKDGDGAWSYATQGPSVLRPEDGAVLGFRFALSEDSRDAAKPRGGADFGAVCGGTGPERGSKRIALALDFGTRADAPRGESPPRRRTACAQVDGDATAADALAKASGRLRYNSDGLLCAIDGYPERGCGEQIADGAGDADADKDGKGGGDGGRSGTGRTEGGEGDGSGGGLGPVTGVAAGLAAVAALAFAAVRRSRRRGPG